MNRDISDMFIIIRDRLTERHGQYMAKFGASAMRRIADENLVSQRVFAKITLLAKAFKDAGVVTDYRAVTVNDQMYEFSQSVELMHGASLHAVYLINEGGSVTVTDSIGMAFNSDLDTRVVLVTSSRRALRKFNDVLAPGFDWEEMADFVLQTIHEVVYDKSHAVQDYFKEHVPGSELTDGDAG